MAPALAVIGAVASVGGTLAAVNQQKKAARLQQRQMDLQAARERRQAIREAQIRRAQGQATAQGLGVGSSSVAAGGAASLSSQLGGTLGFSSQMSGLSSGIAMANQKASFFGGVAQIGAGLFTKAGGFDTLGGMFKGQE